MPANRRPLLERFDALLVDLDGVVYLDEEPIESAVPTLEEARRRGTAIAYVTNNAARTPTEVADRLSRLGLAASAEQIVTSAVGASTLLAHELPRSCDVLVVGGAGLRAAVAEAGLNPVASADGDPGAVVVGWGPDVSWHDLAEAAVAIRRGAQWVATNRDATLPSPRGPLPGAGSLIAALVTATGREPDKTIGKPAPALFQAAVERTGGRHPLVIGDRLDTDIAGANAAGLASLLVLTGVSRPADVLTAPAASRPAYLAADLSALLEPYPDVACGTNSATCGLVSVSLDGGGTRTGPATSAPQPDQPQPARRGDIDGLRAAAALAWAGGLPPIRHPGLLESLGW